MKIKLLGGASVLVLALGMSAGAYAQPNNANNNTNVQAVAQENSGDAVASNNDAVEDGGLATVGNALGQNSTDSALASHGSKATEVDANNTDAVATNKSAATDEGAIVVGHGAALGDDPNNNAIVGGDGYAVYSDEEVADEGSAVHIGNHNGSATAEEDSAAANNHSTAIWADDDVAEDGSAVVTGWDNNTAAADDGGAAVGKQGTAVGISDVEIFDGFNRAVAVDTVGPNGGGEGGGITAAFGIDNEVASAHLASTVSGLALAIDYSEANNFNENGNGNGTEVSTGTIYGNGISSATGANRVVFNTGIANQGRALAVAANSSFGGGNK